MESESLTRLKAAFEDWRSKKRYAREAVPADLLERARAAARCHGPAAVARATKVDRGRFKTGRRMSRGGTRAPAARVPAFSRVELSAPAVTPRPFAEVELPTGLKVRLYTQTGEAFELLSSLCGLGGAR
jgi:hypothetical protein